jgi:2-keto-3-deoxy-L-rhamnonate aldolase RhmA
MRGKISLRDRINKDKVSAGAWITLPELSIAEIYANAGFDWIVVDLEHSTIGIEKMGELIRIIDISGVPALVRVTSNDKNLIKRALDGGAAGIIVPNITSKAEVLEAISSTRYGPSGTRGVGLGRAQAYGNNFLEYFNWVETSGPLVIPMIESKEAVENLSEILSVPGVDVFLIGPYDLSCSLGVPGEFNSEVYKRALKKIMKLGLEVGCTPGIHIVEPIPELLSAAVLDGYKFIACGVDMRMIDIVARQSIKVIDSLRK